MTKRKSAVTATATPAKSRPKLSLSDLNDDPSLINDMSKSDVIRLHKEAELGEVALGGNIRGLLNQLFNVHTGDEA